ncbi:MAG: putative phage tail protein [Planctomycetota bacterium]
MVLSRHRDAAFREALSLLPRGPAWSEDDRSNLAKLLFALGLGPAEIEARVADLLDEIDPRTTSELLSDWERVLGLPDACLPEPSSSEERRALVVSRAIGAGGGTREYLIALAAAVGVPIVIEEGVSTPLRVETGTVEQPIGGELEDFVWSVFAPQTQITPLRVETGRVEDPLRSWGNELLECVLERATPAHTAVRFRYADGSQLLIVFDHTGAPVRIELVDGALPVGTAAGAVRVPADGEFVKVLDHQGLEVCVPFAE